MIYKTIKQGVSVELNIKKSRFISILLPLNHLQNIDQSRHDVRKKYQGANHYCFAYRFRQNGCIMERCSDDGEPSGTAGSPMLNVLKQKELENVMAIVVRYFGGTLLGTGGLVKAYIKGVQAAQEAANIVSMEYSRKVVISIDYSHYGGLEKRLTSMVNRVIDIKYADRVSIELWIADDRVDDFIEMVENISLGTATFKLCEEQFVVI